MCVCVCKREEKQGTWSDWENCHCTLAGQIKGKTADFHIRQKCRRWHKKIIIGVASLSTDGTQFNETACKYVQNTHTHIYIYIEYRACSLYIYILIPRIFLCAFDAQHKLTLQTFCGLKSAASGTLSMASECNTPHPPPLGRVWGVASIVLNSYKAALKAPSCLSASLLATCHLNSSSIELVTRFLSCFSPSCGKYIDEKSKFIA